MRGRFSNCHAGPLPFFSSLFNKTDQEKTCWNQSRKIPDLRNRFVCAGGEYSAIVEAVAIAVDSVVRGLEPAVDAVAVAVDPISAGVDGAGKNRCCGVVTVRIGGKTISVIIVTYVPLAVAIRVCLCRIGVIGAVVDGRGDSHPCPGRPVESGRPSISSWR